MVQYYGMVPFLAKNTETHHFLFISGKGKSGTVPWPLVTYPSGGILLEGSIADLYTSHLQEILTVHRSYST
jgi:hypothetical protein